MKKILCLIDGLGSGGAERQMVGLAILLKQKGYYVDLVAYYEEKNFYVPLAKQGGINPIFLNVNSSRWSKVKVVRRYIIQQGGYDCVISYKSGPNAIACILKLIGLKFRLIVSERNTDSKIGKNRILFNLYRFADYVVPNSYSQGEFLSKHFNWMKKKIVPITNFTDTEYFTPIEEPIHSPLRVLTVARLARQKNILNCLEAVALLRKKGIENVHFDWYGNVGKDQEDYAHLCMVKIKELDLEEVFEFHPETADILKQYQQCDIFCLPSIYEGFPNVVCEAMSCGKPIVCSRVCDNPRIVSEEQNGLLFAPENVEDIVDKLIQMINMTPKHRKQWGKKSREIAIELLSEEAFIQKYIQLIEQ